MASSWVFNAIRAGMTLSWIWIEPRLLTHRESFSRTALVAAWFSISSSIVSEEIAAFSSMEFSWAGCKGSGEDSLYSGLQRLVERVGITFSGELGLRPLGLAVAGAAANGTKMVLALSMRANWRAVRAFQEECAQSIMGATLKRREGSERVVAGLEPVFVVISFNVSCTKFSSFEGVCSKPRSST